MRDFPRQQNNSRIRRYIHNAGVRKDLTNLRIKREIADLKGIYKLRKMDKEVGNYAIRSKFPVATAIVGLTGALGGAIILRAGTAYAPSLLTKAGRANLRKVLKSPIQAFKNRKEPPIRGSIKEVNPLRRGKVESQMEPISPGVYGRYNKDGKLLEVILA